MKNYLRFSLSAMLLMFAFGIFASQASAQIPEILKRMDDHQKALTSLRASVMMDKYNAQLDEHDLYEGNAMYVKVKERDALVKLEWAKPQQEILTVANKKYVLYRPSLKRAITGNTDDAQKKNTAGSGTFDFLKMSKEQLKANYSVKYFGQEEVKGGIPTWHLELTPKTAKSYKSVDIWVDGNGMVLQTKVNENNGDSTTVFLSNLRKNEDIRTADFVLDLPKGTEIVKG
jgi:outer membrane lipoprotein-sorting protein